MQSACSPARHADFFASCIHQTRLDRGGMFGREMQFDMEAASAGLSQSMTQLVNARHISAGLRALVQQHKALDAIAAAAHRARLQDLHFADEFDRRIRHDQMHAVVRPPRLDASDLHVAQLELQPMFFARRQVHDDADIAPARVVGLMFDRLPEAMPQL